MDKPLERAGGAETNVVDWLEMRGVNVNVNGLKRKTLALARWWYREFIEVARLTFDIVHSGQHVKMSGLLSRKEQTAGQAPTDR